MRGDPDKEEYGDIVETNPDPDFDVMLDLILHTKVTTAHVTTLSGKETVYALGKVDFRIKLQKNQSPREHCAPSTGR